MLEKIISHPYVNLFCGIILFVSSSYEVYDNYEEMSLGAHHGVLIFSIVYILQAIPDFIEALRRIDESKKQRSAP